MGRLTIDMADSSQAALEEAVTANHGYQEQVPDPTWPQTVPDPNWQENIADPGWEPYIINPKHGEPGEPDTLPNPDPQGQVPNPNPRGDVPNPQPAPMVPNPQTRLEFTADYFGKLMFGEVTSYRTGRARAQFEQQIAEQTAAAQADFTVTISGDANTPAAPARTRGTVQAPAAEQPAETPS